MPIYMDRHDISELVTAENVAELHRADLKVQHKFNCRGLTYWFDDVKKIAFCLVDAPNKESIQKMHNHAHGEVPNQILEVDASLVESFLGRIKDPVSPLKGVLNVINDPAQRTLMAIRIRSLSLIDLSVSKSETSMQKYAKSINDLLESFEGRLVKQSEGYLLASFKSIKAVLCAFEVEKSLNTLKKGFGNPKISFKIGLATGMPVDKDKSFFEDTIKMANCLCLLERDGIYMSLDVKNAFIAENPDSAFQFKKLQSLESSDERFLNLLMDFIRREWQNAELKVDDFCGSFGMSRTLFYRKMVMLTGQSPNSFVKEYRLTKALERLNLKTKTISEIAFETGFNSTSYFSKCFQKKFGVLPSVYLKP